MIYSHSISHLRTVSKSLKDLRKICDIPIILYRPMQHFFLKELKNLIHLRSESFGLFLKATDTPPLYLENLRINIPGTNKVADN